MYFNPRLIASNGPGTAVPLMLAAYILRRVKLADTKLLYIETFARVNDLSFSAKILYRFSDKFIVQWPDLQRRYPKADFYGHLV